METNIEEKNENSDFTHNFELGFEDIALINCGLDIFILNAYDRFEEIGMDEDTFKALLRLKNYLNEVVVSHVKDKKGEPLGIITNDKNK